MDIAYRDTANFVGWLTDQVILDARGDRFTALPVAPDGRLWLGRIAPEVTVRQNVLGARAERLDPCEIGIRVRPNALDGQTVKCRVRMVAWYQLDAPDDPVAMKWQKTRRVDVPVEITTPTRVGEIIIAGQQEITAALAGVGAAGLQAEVHAELEDGKDNPELVISLVNISPEKIDRLDTNLYEVQLEANMGPTAPFLLDSLPDSFRYDRRVAAYGVNGGIREIESGVFTTTDFGGYDRKRPKYWDDGRLGPTPDLSFQRLSRAPIEPLDAFARAFQSWTETMWSDEAVNERAGDEGWTADMFTLARDEAERARREISRIRMGLDLLQEDPLLLRAFMLANRAFLEAPAIRHEAWRPFQLGFVLSNLSALHPQYRERESDTVDTLWFATGGGKTETYLLFTLTAAFYDRLMGKHEGITSWGRFPLRMLSLQQTQRFADVFAAAELVRQAERIEGSEFSVGFLVGEGGTPNSIPREPRPGQPNYKDKQMPGKYQVLIRCPFCASEALQMRFDEQRWALDHICKAADCPWRGRPLPFRIVDEEIYRWLPTVVLGTLDKAASIAIQGAMRGFYGSPSGKCPKPGHGFTYSPRSKSPTGCLFPGCQERPLKLSQAVSLYPPSIRMQDELHLLRDSLGSVDAHYEALLDGLQRYWGSRAKVIASSATLAGYEEQVTALYRRTGRMFPLPGPRAGQSFWSTDSDDLARRYVGLAPRGVTLEYASDQVTTTLQRSVRRALNEPRIVAEEANVSIDVLPALVWAYGVDILYGTTLKDVEAAARSFGAQIPIEPLNSVTLTGRTPLDEVRAALDQLTKPKESFDERIHLIAASSMLSHGVDIDRLNVMVMLGLPLSTAEFVQTTARVGRRYPGLVFTLHKIGRERDAAVFRIWPSFIEHLDRLIDPVPITARSRRVLELTFPGIEQARIQGIHEPEALERGLKQLTTPATLKRAFTQLPVKEQAELDKLIAMLEFTGPLDENLRNDLRDALRRFFVSLNDPASTAQWVSDLFLRNPMRSLRDVEEQVPVYSKGGRA